MHAKKPPVTLYACTRGRKVVAEPSRGALLCNICSSRHDCDGPTQYEKVPSAVLDLIKLGELPGRVFWVLRRGGRYTGPRKPPIRNWSQLTAISAADLLEYRGVGMLMVRQIREALSARGLTLAGE